MATSEWIEIALAVLPPLPHEVTCIRDDGGQIHISLIARRDAHLYAQLGILDARDGLAITIPVETADRGGYSIGCHITDTYFMGGLESAAALTVTEVRRRKPYRCKERITTDSLAHLQVVTSPRLQPAFPMLARALDVSASGVGLSVEVELDIGDRLRIDTTAHGITISGEIIVVQTRRMAFGRWRVGCQFTRLPLHIEHQLDDLAHSLTHRVAA